MPSIYVCPKCGWRHTLEEYRENRFCRKCEKFLVSRSRISRQFIVQNEEKNNLFPYQPYPEQLKFIEDIEKVVGSCRVLIAEACNGFGKTVCALSSILRLGKKVVYATRTHEQVRQVLIELELINRNSNTSFSAVNLASRRHLCLNAKCRNLSASDAMEACRLLRKEDECSYKTKIELLKYLPQVLSISRLQKQGKIRKICPYFLARKAAEKYTLVVGPYQYIFNEHIRKQVKLDLAGKVLVFDEAHNADQIGQDALSSILSERTLNSAEEELKSINTSNDFIEDLKDYLEKQVIVKVVTKTGLKLKQDLREILQTENLQLLISQYEDLVEDIRIHKMEKGEYPVCFLNGTLTFLKLVESSPCESYVAVYRKSMQGFNLLEYRCLDPSLAIKPVVKKASGALIMSGTLSPLDFFAEILGLFNAERRSYSAIANPENIRTVIDTSVTTKFKERSQAMNKKYGEHISRLVKKIPNGVLVFFPQRRLMVESLNHWNKNQIIKRFDDHLALGGKHMYVEGSGAMENRRTVEEYKKAARMDKGAVLFGVFRGRNAEGSNFPYEEARGVILVGIPYADYSDPVVKAQINFFNKIRSHLGQKWYIMDAFRAANQAIGRGIRHRDDWCNFILMDYRYVNFQHLISKWAVSNGVKKIEL
jgi:Rad3-related DNA helicase